MKVDYRRLFRPHTTVVLSAALGIAFSIGGCLEVRRAETESARTKARSVSADRVGMIHREANEALARLRALRAFYQSSETVTPDEFERFLSESGAGTSPGIVFLWWPAQAPTRRNSFVFPAGSSWSADSLRARSGVREAIRQAARSGELVALPPSSTETPSAAAQIFVFAAVRDPSARPDTDPQGYVAAVLPLDKMVERAIGYLAPGGIDVTIAEALPSGPGRILHFHPSRLRGGTQPTGARRPDLQLTDTLQMPGLQLLIVCDAEPHYWNSGYGKGGWIILVCGLVGTAAFVWWLLDRIGHAARIERLVERRTQQLAAARDHAVQASRLKSQFLANVSHEIRTPLNGISGMTGFLLETSLDAAQREFATTIRDSSNALCVIVNDLLDMARIEAGKLPLHSAVFDVWEVSTTALAGLKPAAAAKGLNLTLDIRPEVPHGVSGDAVRLQQVLVNLLHNAIKFTDTGTVGLRILAEAADDRSHTLRFEVHDTGAGVSPEVREIIFRPFAQADGSHARRHGGLGLGLAICHQIVELMQGQIHLESQPGKGSTFWFTAVFRRCCATAEAPEQLHLAPTDGHSPGPLILLAEDNAVNRRVAGRMLSKLGYTFHEACDGREVIQAIEMHNYAAILMDCQMPFLDGFEATARIRSREGTERHTPIIAVTANAMKGDRERCLALGMDDYIAKPIRLSLLSSVLERWTRDARAASVEVADSPSRQR